MEIMTKVIAQRTEEWELQRLGKITASRLGDVFDYLKSGKPGKARQGYMAEIVAERLTGMRKDRFITKAMQWGIDQEIMAKNELHKQGWDIAEQPFISINEYFGASPDGEFLGYNLEFKCPESTTHLETILTGEIPEKYILQMHAQMLATGLTKSIFISFDSRQPKELQFFKKIVKFDQKIAEKILEEVEKFNNEINQMISELENKIIISNNNFEKESGLN